MALRVEADAQPLDGVIMFFWFWWFMKFGRSPSSTKDPSEGRCAAVALAAGELGCRFVASCFRHLVPKPGSPSVLALYCTARQAFSCGVLLLWLGNSLSCKPPPWHPWCLTVTEAEKLPVTHGPQSLEEPSRMLERRLRILKN